MTTTVKFRSGKRERERDGRKREAAQKEKKKKYSSSLESLVLINDIDWPLSLSLFLSLWCLYSYLFVIKEEGIV